MSQDGPCAQSCHLTRLPRSFRITDLLVHICPFPGGKTEAMGGPFLPKGANPVSCWRPRPEDLQMRAGESRGREGGEDRYG